MMKLIEIVMKFVFIGIFVLIVDLIIFLFGNMLK